MHLVFLSHPIDYVGEAPASAVSVLRRHRQMLHGLAQERAWAIYDAPEVFKIGRCPDPMPEIQQINYYALQQSAGVMALLPEGVRSVGVPMEIQRALDWNKPVAVVGSRSSWALAAGEVYMTEQVTDAVEWLERQFTERQKTDIIRFRLLSSDAQVPVRAFDSDAGYDLFVSRDHEIPPSEFVDIHSDVAAALPVGYWAEITGRSSTLRKKGLMVAQGVIDQGYTGPLYAGVWNLTEHPVQVVRGERIAQLILHPLVGIPTKVVTELPSTERGTAGFGSTGK